MPGTQSAVVRWIGLIVLVLSACTSGKPAPTAAPTIPPTVTLTPTAEIIPLPLSVTSAAPRVRVLALNTSIEGVYAPNQTQQLYLFSLSEPSRIGIVLRAVDGGEPLNLVTRVYNAAGELLPQITAPVGQPMLRNEWDLAPGEYRIEIFGVETQARAFSLIVIERPVGETGGGVIVYGETRSGEIRVRGQRDVWLFQGQAGDHILVSMISPEADAYLELYDPGGNLLSHDDDSAQFGRSPVLELVLPAGGDYRLVARMVDDDQTGTYQITLEQQDRAED